ncbi:MAG: LptF/LptG family permease [Bacteroidales bacterium]|nr:LptF/LptG family permease [Bacteroidales bacterium]
MKSLSLRIKRLDWYIIKKFISTYLVALLIVVAIVIIFDISEKIDYFVERNAPLKEIVFDYYMNFIPYILNMFSPLFVFITVIFFTSKLAANSEIIAMLSSGVSFRRLLVPYMASAAFAAVLSLLLNMYVIPPANYHRLEFEQKYIKAHRYANTNHNIHYQIAPGQFVYVESFSSWNNSVNRFTLETVENNKLVSKMTAASAIWNEEKGGWTCKNYFIRDYDELGNETIRSGPMKDTVIALTLEDFYRRKNVVESLKIQDLNKLIEMQEMRGDKMVMYALIEKHTRIATPFSAFILTLMGVALSSRKRRGGLGLNIGIGVGLSFSYILFMRFSQMFVTTDTLEPWLAIWLPNMIYAVIALFVYRMAPK